MQQPILYIHKKNAASHSGHFTKWHYIMLTKHTTRTSYRGWLGSWDCKRDLEDIVLKLLVTWDKQKCLSIGSSHPSQHLSNSKDVQDLIMGLLSPMQSPLIPVRAPNPSCSCWGSRISETPNRSSCTDCFRSIEMFIQWSYWNPVINNK